jgi:hypothetical protein
MKSAEGYAGRSFVVVNLRGDCSGDLDVRYRQNIGRRRIPRDSKTRAGARVCRLRARCTLFEAHMEARTKPLGLFQSGCG